MFIHRDLTKNKREGDSQGREGGRNRQPSWKGPSVTSGMVPSLVSLSITVCAFASLF